MIYFLKYIIINNNKIIIYKIFFILYIERRLKEAKKPKETPAAQPGKF